VTDALLLAGLIEPDNFGGGQMRIFPEKAMNAAMPLCGDLKMSPDELSRSVYELTVSNIAQQIRRVTVQRGYDPRTYSIMPYGGGGALFAAAVAQEIGAERVIVPPMPGIFSAYGLTVAKARIDAVRSMPGTSVSDLDENTLARIFEELERDLHQRYVGFDMDPDKVQFRRFADVRYLGQGFELNVALKSENTTPIEICDRFHAAHEGRYGHAFRHQTVELVNLRGG